MSVLQKNKQTNKQTNKIWYKLKSMYISCNVALSACVVMYLTFFKKQYKRDMELFIKSNINNWIISSPKKGSLVEWRSGSVNCKIAKCITEKCPNDAPPHFFQTRLQPSYGPSFRGGRLYYYFDGCKQTHWPTHDSCGTNGDNGLKNVQNPHGNIFIRWISSVKAQITLSKTTSFSLIFARIPYAFHDNAAGT